MTTQLDGYVRRVVDHDLAEAGANPTPLGRADYAELVAWGGFSEMVLGPTTHSPTSRNPSRRMTRGTSVRV